jgi:hypothetical protein
MHRACAAEAAAAAELGADEIEVIAQDPEQRRLRINVQLGVAVVDGEVTSMPMYTPPTGVRLRTATRGFADEFRFRV